MQNNVLVTVKEASKITGIHPDTLRRAMQQNRVPYGHAVKGPGGSYSYYIYRKKLKEYVEVPSE